MSSLNQCNFIGNLGKDPDVRYMPNGGAVVNFSIACSESWKDKKGGKQEKTEWINVVAFGKLGEICEKFLSKGSKVFISGKFQTDKYEKEGVTHYSTKINVRDMVMLDSKNETAPKQGASVADKQSEIPAEGMEPKQSSGDDFNDSIPF